MTYNVFGGTLNLDQLLLDAQLRAHVTLNFDRWPWKPFRQRPLMRWIFLASFIEIRPSSTEISPHANRCWRTDGQRTDDQKT